MSRRKNPHGRRAADREDEAPAGEPPWRSRQPQPFALRAVESVEKNHERKGREEMKTTDEIARDCILAWVKSPEELERAIADALRASEARAEKAEAELRAYKAAERLRGVGIETHGGLIAAREVAQAGWRREKARAEKAEADLIKTTALAIRMEAERDRIRAETIEECAKVAASDYAYGIATAIRALGDKA